MWLNSIFCEKIYKEGAYVVICVTVKHFWTADHMQTVRVGHWVIKQSIKYDTKVVVGLKVTEVVKILQMQKKCGTGQGPWGYNPRRVKTDIPAPPLGKTSTWPRVPHWAGIKPSLCRLSQTGLSDVQMKNMLLMSGMQWGWQDKKEANNAGHT